MFSHLVVAYVIKNVVIMISHADFTCGTAPATCTD